MFNGMPPSAFPPSGMPGPGPVPGPYNASMPSNEYMGPASMPNMTLPQPHFHIQSGPHQQHPPGQHPQGGPSLPPDQTSLPYQPQGYVFAPFISISKLAA